MLFWLQYKPILSTNNNHIIGEIKDTLLTDLSSITVTKNNKSSILMSSSKKKMLKNVVKKLVEIVKKSQVEFVNPYNRSIVRRKF